MNSPANQYSPDYAVPPGWILDEYLESWGISQAEFARRCGRSPKFISEILSGVAPLSPETALQFEKVLGLNATVWLGMEVNYRLHLAQEAESIQARAHIEWAKSFPVKELVERGVIETLTSDQGAVSRLLAFFSVASVEAWQTKNEELCVAYRHSPSFESDPNILATWLRIGELMAAEKECAAYNKPKFMRALRRIREFTTMPFEEALAEASRLCSQAGVALVCVKPFKRMAVSGAARWLSPSKAIIQLSARHESDDHFWFSLFHEAAHIILHSKKSIYVDASESMNTNSEAEADKWASDILIPCEEWERFVFSPRFSQAVVCRFAAEQGIAPGIIVGRLQHEKLIPWQNLNGLKAKLRWNGDP